MTYTGSAMTPIAMAFGVLDLTGSAATASFVIAAPIVAQIVVLLVGGVLADRTSRQRIMVGAESLAALAQLAIATLFLSGLATVPLLTVLMLLNGVAVAMFTPAITGFIPQVVARDQLQAANAVLGTARSTAFMAGAALAGLLVAAFGAGVTIAIDGVSFGVSAILLAGIRARRQALTEPASILQDLKLGFAEFVSHRWLWTIVLQFSIMVAAFEATFGLLGPAIARADMDGPVDWGIIAASSGLGTVVGGLLAIRLRVHRPMLFATNCCFFFAGTSLALALFAPLPVIAFAAFVGGVAGQIFAVIWYTNLQQRIPPNMLSRVSAYDHLGSIALAPLGLVIGGLLFESHGRVPTMSVAVAAVVIPTLLVLLVPEVRRLRSLES
ncbi:MAG: MFS transporter [Pseudomonadota bacterium]